MSPVSIASLTQQVLQRITTKDPKGLDHDYVNQLMSYSKPEAMIGLSNHHAGSSKFWDLRDAEQLSMDTAHTFP